MTNTFNENKDPWTDPITLQGRQLTLRPLGLEHLNDLEANLLSKNSWHCVHWGIKTRLDLENGINRSLNLRQKRQESSFALIIQSTQEAVGISRLMNLNRPHRYLEIGGTWVAEKWQKTFVNTEAKLMMLTHAFESIKCQRVEFRVDALNFNSQRGVLRIGAKYEGELRNSAVIADGRTRDYKIYSIIHSEWPNIKTTLNWYLDKYV